MFASSSANVSQGGEKGESDSDRHHRGYVLGTPGILGGGFRQVLAQKGRELQ